MGCVSCSQQLPNVTHRSDEGAGPFAETCRAVDRAGSKFWSSRPKAAAVTWMGSCPKGAVTGTPWHPALEPQRHFSIQLSQKTAPHQQSRRLSGRQVASLGSDSVQSSRQTSIHHWPHPPGGCTEPVCLPSASSRVLSQTGCSRAQTSILSQKNLESRRKWFS